MSISRINENNLNNSYKQLSTMKKVNKAADDAAGAAIVQKLLSQSNGYDVGSKNASAGRDMLAVAEGGLDSIHSNLQRMKEISVQASNGIYTAEDRAIMQEEIEGLKSSIQDAAKGTEFNTMKLLDGSMADKNIATNPDGSGKKISIDSAALDTLGIANFDVTSSFNIKDLDNAINMVSQSRGKIGADQNALEYAKNFNGVASQNLTASRSKIEDADVGRAVSDMQKEKVLVEYQRFAMMEKVKNGTFNINKMLGI